MNRINRIINFIKTNKVNISVTISFITLPMLYLTKSDMLQGFLLAVIVMNIGCKLYWLCETYKLKVKADIEESEINE